MGSAEDKNEGCRNKSKRKRESDGSYSRMIGASDTCCISGYTRDKNLHSALCKQNPRSPRYIPTILRREFCLVLRAQDNQQLKLV